MGELFITVQESNMHNVLIDIETGVNYIEYTRGGICPRYNRDGSLVVSGRSEIQRYLENQEKNKIKGI